MISDQPDITRLRAEFAQPDEAPNPEGCPSPERLWSAAQGELLPDEIRAVIEHLATCAPCAEEWRLAVALAEPLPQAEEGARPVASSRRTVLRLLAASLVAAAVGGPFLLHRGRDEMRGVRTEITSSDDNGTQPRDRFQLHWIPPSDSTSCDLEVFSDASETAWEKEGIVGHEYQVPPSSLRALPAGATVNWQVTCHLRGGAQRTSNTFKTRLR